MSRRFVSWSLTTDLTSRELIVGTQGKIRLQVGADAKPGRRHSGQQSVLPVREGSEPTVQNRDAGELSVRLAYEANDTEAPRGMRSGDILRSPRSLEEAQYIRLRLREQEDWMQREAVGTGVSADASQKCSW